MGLWRRLCDTLCMGLCIGNLPFLPFRHWFRVRLFSIVNIYYRRPVPTGTGINYHEVPRAMNTVTPPVSVPMKSDESCLSSLLLLAELPRESAIRRRREGSP